MFVADLLDLVFAILLFVTFDLLFFAYFSAEYRCSNYFWAVGPMNVVLPYASTAGG